MTEQHPITPPSELVQQWATEYWGPGADLGEGEKYIATQAARWGGDQELKACCEWLQDPDLNVDTYKLRAARRPKPPSLKEQALATLQKLSKDDYPCNYQNDKDWDTIRRALDQLDG